MPCPEFNAFQQLKLDAGGAKVPLPDVKTKSHDPSLACAGSPFVLGQTSVVQFTRTGRSCARFWDVVTAKMIMELVTVLLMRETNSFEA